MAASHTDASQLENRDEDEDDGGEDDDDDDDYYFGGDGDDDDDPDISHSNKVKGLRVLHCG